MKKSKLIGLAAGAAKNPDMSFVQSLRVFGRMMYSTFKGKYSPKTMNLLIGAGIILYVVSPLDFIPGFILDDAAIVFLALKYFRKELNRFLEWEKAQKMKPYITEANIVND